MTQTTHLVSLAYYLPQFHEIEENNRWWGQGFTEWQQLNEANIYFDWHSLRKPDTPFGQYSLLNPDVLAWQNDIALAHGIDGFLVFDYWFGQGKKLLEKPMQVVLEQKVPFRYAFCWANHTWYNKRENITLQPQQYLGAKDYTDYFMQLLPHFQSGQYIIVNNKPVFSIFNPKEIPDLDVFLNTFNDLAKQYGFAGIYWLADNTDDTSVWTSHFDGYTKSATIFKYRKKNRLWSYCLEKLTRKFHLQNLGPFVYDYEALSIRYSHLSQDSKQVPVVFTGWDTSPRHLKRGTILKGFDVDRFKAHLDAISTQLLARPHRNSTQVILIKSWNEWAEGNVIEPDDQFGFALLELYRDFVISLSSDLNSSGKGG
jgi:hypothetical protein